MTNKPTAELIAWIDQDIASLNEEIASAEDHSTMQARFIIQRNNIAAIKDRLAEYEAALKLAKLALYRSEAIQPKHEQKHLEAFNAVKQAIQ